MTGISRTKGKVETRNYTGVIFPTPWPNLTLSSGPVPLEDLLVDRVKGCDVWPKDWRYQSPTGEPDPKMILRNWVSKLSRDTVSSVSTEEVLCPTLDTKPYLKLNTINTPIT